jgi:hypothetical protein
MDADDDYFRYPVGSPEHYAAYERYFHSKDGIDCVFPGDPESSYEADFAGELANASWDDEMCNSGYQQWVEESARWWRARGVQIAEDLVDEPGSWLDGDWWQSRIPDPDYHGPDIDPEPF